MARARDGILEAAARAFARTGYVGTTMEKIAQEAGYTVPTLYRYFEGKEEILLSLFTRTAEDLFATFDESVPPGLSFRQRLELLLRRQFELADRRRDDFAVFHSVRPTDEMAAAWSDAMSEASGRPDWQVLTCDPGPELYEQRLAKWIGDVAGRSELGGHDPAELASLLAAMGEAIFRRWRQGRLEGRMVDRVSFVVALFFDGLEGTAKRTAAGAKGKRR